MCEIADWLSKITEQLFRSIKYIPTHPLRPLLPPDCSTSYCTRLRPHNYELPFKIAACAIATGCCISDVPCQWKGQNFDPHSSPIFQPILMKLKTKKDIRDTTPHTKFG